jgi:hypothetical protein
MFRRPPRTENVRNRVRDPDAAQSYNCNIMHTPGWKLGEVPGASVGCSDSPSRVGIFGTRDRKVMRRRSDEVHAR